MGLVKGVKNIFGRKARKQKKAMRQMDTLREDLDDPLKGDLWSNNGLYVAPPKPEQEAKRGPKNDFEAIAKKKKAKTGKGMGKTRLKDRHIGEMKQGAEDVGASAHEVKRVDYAREIGDSGTNEGFFKAADEKTFHGSFNAVDSGIGEFDMTSTDDISGKGAVATVAPNLIGRSVANTRLDQRLGLNTIAHEFEAKHGGERGVVSAKTDGKAAHDVNDVDYSGPEMQRSLSDLQVFDYLTNQQDRHDGNVFVDEKSGTAKGIDNDLSFGKTSLRANDRNHGLPSQIDSTMAARIEGLGPKELRKLLGGKKGDYQKLSEDEVEAAVERLERLQSHILAEDENGDRKHVVDEWNEDTFNKTLEESKAAGGDDMFSAADVGFNSKSITARLHYMQELRKRNNM